jgi:hypothetical protein
VSTQDWPGEAAVDVSIVNWVNQPGEAPRSFVLDGEGVPGITPSLRSTEAPDVARATRLHAQLGRSFEGVKPGGAGFVLSEGEALALRADGRYRAVVRRYLVGDDIVKDPRQGPRRWIIDFATMSLEEAMEYPLALEIVRARVKPIRDQNRRRIRRERWWIFSEPVPAMRAALEGLRRFLASNVQGQACSFRVVRAGRLPKQSHEGVRVRRRERFRSADLDRSPVVGAGAIIDPRRSFSVHTDLRVRDVPLAERRAR